MSAQTVIIPPPWNDGTTNLLNTVDISETPCIAGIGASAGGYEAVRQFLQIMPVDSGIAFVIIQHLDPTHTSLAAELFGKYTAMPVNEIVDGALIEANHVYTLPSDKEVVISENRLHLTPRAHHQSLRLPIDHFFNSLGANCGTKAIGIILSGNGSDGALGLKKISIHGGIVLVQEPSMAQFDGMPRSAIATGIANYVLPIEQMPEVLVGYALHPYVTSSAKTGDNEIDTPTMRRLLGIIQIRHSYDFSSYKSTTLQRRIQRRMDLRSTRTKAEYVALLEQNHAEVDALFHDLLIGVTEFFRDADAWRALETEVIAPLVATKSHDAHIRIWVPGCSTGEEVYTVAIIVLDCLRKANKHCSVQIFATDTNSHALEVGRRGHYPTGIADRISPERLQRYFIEDQSQQDFVVTSELRTAVVFGVQNLFADPPFSRIDLISCRNVLIYLEPKVQKHILSIFHFALNQDAYLFLGSAESNNNHDNLFRLISKEWRIYQREGSIRSVPPPFPLRTNTRELTPLAPPPTHGTVAESNCEHCSETDS
ncbi:two-component system, chemotaxis family, CheB/CheR fusion protein [Gammaproteobacteria bacterium]